MQTPSINGGPSRPIVQFSRDDLQPGKLETIFQGGAKAVILENDDRVRQIWEGLLGLTVDHVSPSYNKGLHPWNNNILAIARNHRSRNIMLGDVFRFIPGDYAAVSRKIITFPDSHGTMKILPENLFVGSQRVTFPQEILKTAWDLMEEVLLSTLSAKIHPRPYAVKIELIKYPNSNEDVEHITSLLLDGLGSLAYWGYRVKCARSSAVGIFDVYGMRVFYALSSLIPGINILSAKLNNIMKPFSKKRTLEGSHLIHFPHVDTGKVITALIGDRSSVNTEVFDGTNWVDLPISSTSLSFFPGQNGGQPTNVSPSVHRVLIKDEANCPPVGDSPNIAILLGLIEHPESS